MEKIIFYKLISPYPEDITLNKALTSCDVDSNFLAFKDNDISGATYDTENMVIDVIRNNGEHISIDISEIEQQYKDAITEATSGITPSVVDINLEGDLVEDGTLVLSWRDDTGEHNVEIGGFLTETTVKHDHTLSGDGSDENPLSLDETERTGVYSPVLGITDELPVDNVHIGSRWVVKKMQSLFGRLYNREGMVAIEDELKKRESLWRVPSLDDWNKLLTYADVCDISYEGSVTGEYTGDVAGKMLKSVNYWVSGESLDKYGFSACPAGYIKDSIITGQGEEARFWTSTSFDDSQFYINGFSYNHNDVLQDVSAEDEYYSIRLVMDVSDKLPDEYVNILGGLYKVVVIEDIKQAWIVGNLSYNPGYSISEEFEYEYDGLITEKYYISHWNGKYWKQKALNNGDKFVTARNGMVVEYTCVEDIEGNQELVKGLTYKLENGVRKLIIDAGWY